MRSGTGSEEAVGACSFCGRKTWERVELGRWCSMPRPTGDRCHGTILAAAPFAEALDFDAWYAARLAPTDRVECLEAFRAGVYSVRSQPTVEPGRVREVIARLVKAGPSADNSQFAGDPSRWPVYSINDIRAAIDGKAP